MNPLELFQVEVGEAMQDGIAMPSESHAHKAAVAPALAFVNQALATSPLHEAHHRVVALLQELGQFAYGGPAAARVARHSQKQHVLLGRQAMLTRGPFAETQEAPKVVTEPGKAPKDKRFR